MAINPEAVHARDSADYSTEAIRKRQANRPAESFVGYWDDQLIADVTALLANDLNLNSIIGDYIRSTQEQAERIDTLLAEVERLRSGHVVLSCACGHGPENHVVTRSCRKCPGLDVIFDGKRATQLPFGEGDHESRTFTAEYLNEPPAR